MSTRSETAAHRALKRAAVLWAQVQGFNLVAEEVRIPRSSYRADVVACETTLKGGPRVLRSAIFECKQARSDLLKDSRAIQHTTERIAELMARKHELDRLLGLHYPSLRRSDELFAEFVVPVEADKLGHEGYAAIVRELDRLQRRLYGKTKFDRLRTYKNADLHYIVIGPGILRAHEAPAGWGLLEWDGLTMEPQYPEVPRLTLTTQPTFCQTLEACRTELLIGIARTATRALNKHHQLSSEAMFERRKG
ncbi:MAG: hypothetical protein JWO08_1636 [Verrucomicrobiaceae bacterium]|nr:hypothetical protein [Verrucomicrobiaceae bacterium]